MEIGMKRGVAGVCAYVCCGERRISSGQGLPATSTRNERTMASGLRSASPVVHVVCSPDPDPA